MTVQPGASVAISISPTSAALASGAQKQFAATISNTSNLQVVWSASSGSIAATGLYTAPAVSSATAATVTNTSQADTTKTAISSSANQRSRASFCVAVLELGRHLGGRYRMYRSTISGSSYGLLASAISGTSYSDQTVQSGTAYYYVVTAVDSAGREIPIHVR